jgi:hypothetical protein
MVFSLPAANGIASAGKGKFWQFPRSEESSFIGIIPSLKLTTKKLSLVENEYGGAAPP